jgi:hypothetical protein
VKEKESTSFLKKRSKKLLVLRAGTPASPQPPVNRSFFGSPGGAPFFAKKELLTFRGALNGPV